jgi:hypothetical protein
MAQVTSFRDDRTGQFSGQVSNLVKPINVVNASAASGDNIEVFMVPYGQNWRLIGASLRQSATLGASATASLQVNRSGVRTVIAGPTTAGAAGKVNSSADTDIPFDLQGGDVIEIQINGAGITASATLTTSLDYTAR